MIRLLWVIALLILPVPAFAQDGDEAFCKARFIPCIQATGRPMECQSIYSTCMDAVPITGIPTGISGQVEITLNGSTPIAKLALRNDTTTPFNTGYQKGTVRCGDGSIETVTFHSSGILDPGAQSLTSASVVCLGKPGTPQAMPIGPTPLESPDLFIACGPENTRRVALTPINGPQGLVAFNYAAIDDGYSGNIRVERGIDAVLAEVCTAPPRADPSVIVFVYGWFRDLLNLFPEEFKCHPSDVMTTPQERTDVGMLARPTDCPNRQFGTVALAERG